LLVVKIGHMTDLLHSSTKFHIQPPEDPCGSGN